MASADRGQFFRAAAEAMRRVHVDHARRKRAAKRCGRRRRFDLCEGDRVAVPDPDTLLAVDKALKALGVDDPESADVARLRLFPGRRSTRQRPHWRCPGRPRSGTGRMPGRILPPRSRPSDDSRRSWVPSSEIYEVAESAVEL